jgi:hypothetical protein
VPWGFALSAGLFKLCFLCYCFPFSAACQNKSGVSAPGKRLGGTSFVVHDSIDDGCV